ncbi:hypothetical protein ACJIZ3_006213 [Penstemon smallii]|uniref:Uncharacterized protein n=1 Tax=Penstemon smallii TaxID=265156 RepID=A0ABD3S769_9LAMI
MLIICYFFINIVILILIMKHDSYIPMPLYIIFHSLS